MEWTHSINVFKLCWLLTHVYLVMIVVWVFEWLELVHHWTQLKIIQIEIIILLVYDNTFWAEADGNSPQKPLTLLYYVLRKCEIPNIKFSDRDLAWVS